MNRNFPADVEILSSSSANTSSPPYELSMLPTFFHLEGFWTIGKGPELARQLKLLILSSIILYMPFLWILQRWMLRRPAYRISAVTFLWNVSLSLMSLLGFVILILGEWRLLLKTASHEIYYLPSTRMVVTVFALTKTVEFGDSVLLVLKKKPLSFLHCYHHISVALYCLHGQLANVSFGHHFAFVNLLVHAVMYCYYALTTVLSVLPLPAESSSSIAVAEKISVAIRHPSAAAAGTGGKKAGAQRRERHDASHNAKESLTDAFRRQLKKGLQASRPYITISQVLQMFIGLGLSVNATVSYATLSTEKSNAYFALAMYISYAWLFTKYYVETHVYPKKSFSSISPSISGDLGGSAVSSDNNTADGFPTSDRARLSGGSLKSYVEGKAIVRDDTSASMLLSGETAEKTTDKEGIGNGGGGKVVDGREEMVGVSSRENGLKSQLKQETTSLVKQFQEAHQRLRRGHHH